VAPEEVATDFGSFESERIDDVNLVRDSETDTQLTDGPQRSGQLRRQTNHVIFTYGRDFHGKGHLVVEGITVDIMGYETLTIVAATGNYGLEEVHNLRGVIFFVEEKVQALVNCFNSGTVGEGSMLEEQLLQVKECLLVICPLSDLNHGAPEVLGLNPVTLIAHLIGHNVLHDKHLLENCASHYFLLNGQFHFQSLRMGFCPNKCGVNQMNSAQSFEFFETQREQFPRFEGTKNPLTLDLKIFFTSFTPVNSGLFGDTLRDVHFASKTTHAHVGSIGFNGGPAFAAKNPTLGLNFGLFSAHVLHG
jgi:hypothetical protein